MNTFGTLINCEGITALSPPFEPRTGNSMAFPVLRPSYMEASISYCTGASRIPSCLGISWVAEYSTEIYCAFRISSCLIVQLSCCRPATTHPQGGNIAAQTQISSSLRLRSKRPITLQIVMVRYLYFGAHRSHTANHFSDCILCFRLQAMLMSFGR